MVQRLPDDQARILAVGALGQIKSEQAVKPLTGSGNRPKRGRAKKSSFIAWYSRIKVALPYLTDVMKDERRNVEVRLAAAGAAAKLGANEAVDTLYALISKSDYSLIGTTAVKLLAEIETEKSTLCLAKVLGPMYQIHQDTPLIMITAMLNTRGQHSSSGGSCACKTPHRISHVLSGNVVCAKPSQLDSYVVRTAADALIEMDPKQALEYFQKALWSEQNVSVVAHGLAQISTEKAGAALLDAVEETVATTLRGLRV